MFENMDEMALCDLMGEFVSLREYGERLGSVLTSTSVIRYY